MNFICEIEHINLGQRSHRWVFPFFKSFLALFKNQFWVNLVLYELWHNKNTGNKIGFSFKCSMFNTNTIITGSETNFNPYLIMAAMMNKIPKQRPISFHFKQRNLGNILFILSFSSYHIEKWIRFRCLINFCWISGYYLALSWFFKGNPSYDFIKCTIF